MVNVVITAAATGYASASDALDVLDFEELTITLRVEVMLETDGSTIATVTRGNSDVDAPLVVEISTSDPSEATVPATVTILAGNSATEFPVTAIDDAVEDGSQTVHITVSATGYVPVSIQLEVQDNPTPWRNVLDANDVNADGFVTPHDVLVTINHINLFGPFELPYPTETFHPRPFYDVNGDGFITSRDIGIVINFLNRQLSEGEAIANRSVRAAIFANMLELFPFDISRGSNEVNPRDFRSRQRRHSTTQLHQMTRQGDTNAMSSKLRRGNPQEGSRETQLDSPKFESLLDALTDDRPLDDKVSRLL
jgi:hypothetical protein